MNADSNPTLAEFRRLRNKRIQQSVTWSLLIKPLSFVVPAVTLPLQLSYLGVARFGLLESAGAVAIWLAMSNLGMGLGLINRLTECAASHDREKAGKYTATLSLALAAVVAALLVLVSLVVPQLPWGQWLHVPDGVASAEAAPAVAVACVLAVIGLFSSLPNAIYSGYQENHKNVIWDGIAKLSVLAATAFVVTNPAYGVVGVVLAAAGAPVFVRIINLVWLVTREKPWLMPRLHRFDAGMLRGMLSEGLMMFGLAAGNMLLFQADKLVLATGRDLTEVAAYSFVTRLFIMGYGVYMMYLTPLWPAVGDALHRGDPEWVEMRVKRASVVGVAMMLAGGAAILGIRYVAREWLQGLHDGSPLPISSGLVIGVTAMFCARVWVDAHSTALNAAGLLRQQIPFYLAHAILNLGVSLVVVGKYGAEGVAWSTAGTAVFTTVWAYRSLFNRMLAEKCVSRPQEAGEQVAEARQQLQEDRRID